MGDLRDPPSVRDDSEQEDEFLIDLLDAAHGHNVAQVQGLLESAPAQVPLSKLQLIVSLIIETLHMVNVDIIRMILEYEPEIARSEISKRDGFLLHVACKHHARLDVLRRVIDAYPDALREKDSAGKLPSHRTFEFDEEGPSLDVVQLLLSAYLDAARIPQTRNGMLPLHLALVVPTSPDAIIDILDAYPEAAAVPMNGGTMALHLAFTEDLPVEIVNRLVELCPEALGSVDSHGMIPLHCALRSSRMTLDMLRWMVEKCPDSVRTKGQFGMLPLHYAVSGRDVPLELIQYLVQVYPDAVSIASDAGTLPIHEACASRGTSREVIELLLDRYEGPESHHRGLSVTNQDGRAPLHMYAAIPDHDSELLQHLISLYPEAIHVVDRNRRLPLHESCECPRPVLGSIRNLVEADRFTILEKTLDGRTPYQLAWRLHRRRPDVERYLVEKQNEVVNVMKEAFEDVADTQLGLPDLVVARVWSFAKPDLWQPPR